MSDLMNDLERQFINDHKLDAVSSEWFEKLILRARTQGKIEGMAEMSQKAEELITKHGAM